MKKSDFSARFLVNENAEKIFAAILQVRDWWGKDIEGSTTMLNDEFIFRAGEVHVSTQKVIELIPFQKITWLVTDSSLNFLKNKSEWTGIKIYFEITPVQSQSQLTFTHQGLLPEIECYEACSTAWSQILESGLLQFIRTGIANPIF